MGEHSENAGESNLRLAPLWSWEKKKAVATVADGSPQKYKFTQKKTQVYHVQEMPGLGGTRRLGMEGMQLVLGAGDS